MKLSEITEFTDLVVPAGSFVPTVINDNGNYRLRKVNPALLGATGPQGPAGNSFFSGASTPSASLGEDDDFYIHTGTGALYQKQSGTWTLVGSLKGPTGATGATGATGPTGPAGADGADAVPAGSAGYVQYHDGGAPAALDASATFQFDDTNDELYVNGNVRVGVESLVFASSLNIDLRGAAVQLLTVTGTITLGGTNYATGRQVTVVLTDNGSGNTINFDADWTFVGTKPTALTASKKSVLTLTDTTGNAGGTGIIAAFSEQT